MKKMSFGGLASFLEDSISETGLQKVETIEIKQYNKYNMYWSELTTLDLGFL